MPLNVQDFWHQIMMMAGGVIVLTVFAVTLGMKHRPKIRPAGKGHREEESDSEESIRPDGYIDSFAGTIEEAGGGMPPIVKVFLPGILLWWLAYLIIYIVIV